AARDPADDRSVLGDLVPVPSDPAVDDETGDLSRGPLGLFRGDHVPAGEFLVELAGPAEARLDRVGGLVDVVPVERKARFEAERVAGTEADRLDALLGTPREQPVPDPGGVRVRHEDLEAVLARVPGAGQRRAGSSDAAV